MNNRDRVILDTSDEELATFPNGPVLLNRKRTLEQQIADKRQARESVLTQPPADQPLNKFERHSLITKSKRAATATAVDEREQKRDQDRQTWNRGSQGPNGTLLDPKTAEAKANFEASRTVQQQPQPQGRVINMSALKACIAVQVAQHPEFIPTPHNAEALNRLIQHHLKKGWEVSTEMIEEAIRYGYERNCFETQLTRDPNTGVVIRKRGEGFFASPPIMPERCIWADEEALLIQQEAEEAVRLSNEEAQRAIALPFVELQKQVRAGFKRGRTPANLEGEESVR